MATSVPPYYDYPLEQGLRRSPPERTPPHLVYYDYPLEQGLRHCGGSYRPFGFLYYDYPLEQGLRHSLIHRVLGQV